MENNTVIFYPGVWDLIHTGHVKALNSVKNFGTVVVGVCDDETVKRHKGEYSVLNTYERLELIRELGYNAVVYGLLKSYKDCVGYIENKYEPSHLIFAHSPEFGEREDQKEFLRWCLTNGITTLQIPYYDGISSTMIKNRIKVREVSSNGV